MASFPRAHARPNGLVPGFASRDDMLKALNSLHIKPSDLQLLFHCSRGTVEKLMRRPDFPRPCDLTEDGRNRRFSVDEVLAWRNEHRREVRTLLRPKPPLVSPPPSAEAAVRSGLAALRAGKKGDPTEFR